MGTTFGRLVLLAAAVVGFVCGGVGACTGPQKEPVVQPAPLTVGGTPPTVSSAPVAWPELSVMPAQGGGQNDAALVIGIQDYAYAPDVPGAAQNAEDWYQYLVKTRQVPIGSVKLLRDGEASLELMEEAAAEVAAKVKPGGTLWVVFIGHGAPAQDDGVLIGADAQQNPKSLYARSLPQKRLAELTKGQQAQTLLVLDACFSGQVSDGKMFASGLQPLLLVKMPENITVLSAGGASEFAGPLPNTARPAFSYLMLGAMRGWGDANGDKQVTAEEAVNYTRDVLQTVVKDRKQTPQASGPKIDFVLSKVEVLEQGPDLVAMVLGKPAAVAAVVPSPVIDPPTPPQPPERVLPITNPQPPTPPSDSQNNNQRADSQNNNQRADRQSGDQQNNQRATASREGMVEVPAGEFWMGHGKGASKVYLDAYLIDKTEVTVDAYAMCVEAGGCQQPGVGEMCNWQASGKGDHPINCVTFDEADAFCKWAGKQLPTETQWEKAARGLDGRIYPWGDQEASCNFAVLLAAGEEDCGANGTLPVGSRPGGFSPYGALDMVGNVWEWTISETLEVVMRGGSFNDDFGIAEWATSYRFDADPETANDGLGLRCVMPLSR